MLTTALLAMAGARGARSAELDDIPGTGPPTQLGARNLPPQERTPRADAVHAACFHTIAPLAQCARNAHAMHVLQVQVHGGRRGQRSLWLTLTMGRPHLVQPCQVSEDCRDGVLLLKVCERLRPGCVQWGKVRTRHTSVYARAEVCNYALEVARSLGMTAVGISGQARTPLSHLAISPRGQASAPRHARRLPLHMPTMLSTEASHATCTHARMHTCTHGRPRPEQDIAAGAAKLTLGVVWQLMRADVLRFLSTVQAPHGYLVITPRLSRPHAPQPQQGRHKATPFVCPWHHMAGLTATRVVALGGSTRW